MGQIVKANTLTSRGLEPGTWRVDCEKLDRFLDKLAQEGKEAWN